MSLVVIEIFFTVIFIKMETFIHFHCIIILFEIVGSIVSKIATTKSQVKHSLYPVKVQKKRKHRGWKIKIYEKHANLQTADPERLIRSDRYEDRGNNKIDITGRGTFVLIAQKDKSPSRSFTLWHGPLAIGIQSGGSLGSVLRRRGHVSPWTIGGGGGGRK